MFRFTKQIIHRVINRGNRYLHYQTPQKEISFILNRVHNIENHYQKLGVDKDKIGVMDEIIAECAKFSETELLPIRSDAEHPGACMIHKQMDISSDVGTVWTTFTPVSWKKAWGKYTSAGWQGLSMPEKWGGQGFPPSMGVIKSEIIGGPNWAWSMYPGLGMGAANTLLLHGNEEQKDFYLRKLVSGEWLGTMCLTEPQCGSDLGQVKCQATRMASGLGGDQPMYRLNGTKIFISCGDHQWTDNILHIVLARLPDAPEGTAGISLFLVPKYLTKSDGSLDQSHLNVQCARLEEKMGIHGSTTCEIVFDQSIGYMIGQPNTGLKQMFTFMNTARLGTALQGLTTMELTYQNAVSYAKDRLAFRALGLSQTGRVEIQPHYPNLEADPILVHPDVRRMLLTIRSVLEPGRALLYETAFLADSWFLAENDQDRQNWNRKLGLMTPIIKGFLTEFGQESANLGLQVYGGHGYIKEHGMEQIVRDARISTIYEGTTGIQALDLLGRKVMLDRGREMALHINDRLKESSRFMAGKDRNWTERRLALTVNRHLAEWGYLTSRLMLKARNDPNVVGAGGYDYLMYVGYVECAFWWLKILEQDPSRLSIAQFYFDRVLPRTRAHVKMMKSGSKSTMNLSDDQF